MIWDELLSCLFGKNNLQHIENFGHYIVQRSQLIYFKIKTDSQSQFLGNIYKQRFIKYLETGLLKISGDSSDNTIKQFFGKDIEWVLEIQKRELLCNSSAKFFQKGFRKIPNDPFA